MVNNKTLYQMGKDVNRNWSFKNGDVELCNYENNIHQAIQNRLSCPLGALQLFYTDYGSTVEEYLGEPNNETIREYIRLEVEKRLKYDPRFQNIECVVEYVNSSEVGCRIKVTFADGESYEDNYVIGVANMNPNDKKEVLILTPLITAQITEDELFYYPITITTKEGISIKNLGITVKTTLYNVVEWEEEFVTDETGTVYIEVALPGDYTFEIRTPETDTFYHNSSSVQLILLGGD